MQDGGENEQTTPQGQSNESSGGNQTTSESTPASAIPERVTIISEITQIKNNAQDIPKPSSPQSDRE